MYWVHNRITRGRFKPKWIFKCDDDNLVDIYSFEKYVISLEDQMKNEADSNKIFCYVRDDAVPMRPGTVYIRTVTSYSKVSIKRPVLLNNLVQFRKKLL